jgi:hypothetical protein
MYFIAVNMCIHPGECIRVRVKGIYWSGFIASSLINCCDLAGVNCGWQSDYLPNSASLSVAVGSQTSSPPAGPIGPLSGAATMRPRTYCTSNMVWENRLGLDLAGTGFANFSKFFKKFFLQHSFN